MEVGDGPLLTRLLSAALGLFMRLSQARFEEGMSRHLSYALVPPLFTSVVGMYL